MQVDLVSAVMIQVVAMIGIFAFTILLFYREAKPFKKLGKIIDNVVEDDESVSDLSDSITSLKEIGTLAQTGNAILQDEEMLDGLLQQIAKRAFKIAQMSMLGGKSGDSRRMAKAETMVNEAMIEGAAKLNPIIGIVLKATGLDEELKKDPEMFGYIMQVVQDRGLLNMLDPSALSLPSAGTEQQSDVTKSGIDF